MPPSEGGKLSGGEVLGEKAPGPSSLEKGFRVQEGIAASEGPESLLKTVPGPAAGINAAPLDEVNDTVGCLLPCLTFLSDDVVFVFRICLKIGRVVRIEGVLIRLSMVWPQCGARMEVLWRALSSGGIRPRSRLAPSESSPTSTERAYF